MRSRRLHDLAVTPAAHEARLAVVEVDVAELRDWRVDPAQHPEVVAAQVLELVGPSAVRRLADALLVAADDLGGDAA